MGKRKQRSKGKEKARPVQASCDHYKNLSMTPCKYKRQEQHSHEPGRTPPAKEHGEESGSLVVGQISKQGAFAIRRDHAMQERQQLPHKQIVGRATSDTKKDKRPNVLKSIPHRCIPVNVHDVIASWESCLRDKVSGPPAFCHEPASETGQKQR